MNAAREQRLTTAWAELRAGRPAAAEEAARALVRDSADDADALHLLALACHRQGRGDEAISLFHAAVAARPADGEILNNQGCMLMELGRRSEAAAALQRALSLRPGDVMTLRNLGSVLGALGRFGAAARVLQQAVELKPDFVDAHLGLARVLLDLGRPHEALAHAQRAAQGQPNIAQAQATLGLVLHELGRPSEAVAALRRALSIDPEHAEARANLRVVYAAMVPAWHFAMLNDDARNDAYDRAIRAAVRPGDHVLEIGTGSGILAMMAARAGAERVTTCEVNPALAEVARRIVAANAYAERVSVIGRKSTQLEVGRDLPRPADLLIMEIFDSALLGEGVLPSLADARARLLAPAARVLPQRARVYAAAVEMPGLRRVNPIRRIAGFDLSPFEVFSNPAGQMLELGAEPHRLLTDPVAVFDFDFRAPVPNAGEKRIEVAAAAAGTVHAVAVWYDLFLDDRTTMTTAPGIERNHWKQAVEFLPADIPVAAGQSLVALARYAGTRLKVEMGPG
ncbi:MAG: tetratricopeptide repeat protein [Alphaproteobacteria bacterium]|nr:tetratricopeptide repeat protein [Alphaproteobacteria bacterium]